MLPVREGIMKKTGIKRGNTGLAWNNAESIPWTEYGYPIFVPEISTHSPTEL